MQLIERHGGAARAAAASFAAWIDRHRTLVDTLRHLFISAMPYNGR
jgi:hypothetical protein